jgi:hypothetical protein
MGARTTIDFYLSNVCLLLLRSFRAVIYRKAVFSPGSVQKLFRHAATCTIYLIFPSYTIQSNGISKHWFCKNYRRKSSGQVCSTPATSTDRTDCVCCRSIREDVAHKIKSVQARFPRFQPQLLYRASWRST